MLLDNQQRALVRIREASVIDQIRWLRSGRNDRTAVVQRRQDAFALNVPGQDVITAELDGIERGSKLIKQNRRNNANAL